MTLSMPHLREALGLTVDTPIYLSLHEDEPLPWDRQTRYEAKYDGYTRIVSRLDPFYFRPINSREIESAVQYQWPRATGGKAELSHCALGNGEVVLIPFALGAVTTIVADVQPCIAAGELTVCSGALARLEETKCKYNATVADLLVALSCRVEDDAVARLIRKNLVSFARRYNTNHPMPIHAVAAVISEVNRHCHETGLMATEGNFSAYDTACAARSAVREYFTTIELGDW